MVFTLMDERLVLVTEREIFHKSKNVVRVPVTFPMQSVSKITMNLKRVIMLYTRLMVSVNLKVLRTIEIKGVHRDHLTIQYQRSGARKRRETR